MRRGLVVCGVLVASAIAGCGLASTAERDATITADGGHDASRVDARPTPASDAGQTGRDGGHDANDSTGPTCLIACTTDSQCNAGCGAVVGGGIRCCDPPTNRCFVSHAGYCPEPVDGGGAPWGSADTGLDAAADAACAPSSPDSTEIAVTAHGMPGATLTLNTWWGPTAPVTLDDTGSVVFHGPALSIGRYTGAGSSLVLLDAIGFPVSFRLQSGSAMADVYPTCIAPDPGSLQPLDRIDVVLQRELTTGLCAGSVLSVVFQCVPLTGEYTPAMFDDMPCGPFR